MTSLMSRLARWMTGSTAGDTGTEPPAQPLEALRHDAGAAVVDMDDAIRASGRELELATTQVGEEGCRPFAATLDAARERAREALRHHHEATELARSGSPDETAERLALSHVLDGARRVHELLDADAPAFERLRDLRARTPELLARLGATADEVEREITDAEAEVALLGQDHDAASLTSIADNPGRARELVTAARGLVQDGRQHLAERDDRAAAAVAVRGAETALQQARVELAEVGAARGALATARADVEAGLASIRSDLDDAQRLSATDERTAAAIRAAEPVIASADAALAARGDLLAALTDLTGAEEVVDAALEPYREAAERQRRELPRLQRRIRNSRVFVDGVDRRLTSWPGGSAPQARSDIAEAARLVAEATQLFPDDPAAVTSRLDRAGALARGVQDSLDTATVNMAHAAGVGDPTPGEMVLGTLGVGVLAIALGGWGGSSSGSGHSSSSGGGTSGGSRGGSGGFGGGGRF